MKKIFLLFVMSMFLFGCVPSSAILAPTDVRIIKKKITVLSSNKKDIFNRAQMWLSQDHSGSKITISYADMEHLQILAKVNMRCDASLGADVRNMGLGFNQNKMQFNIDFQIKNNESCITYSELYYYLQDIRYPESVLVQGPSSNIDVITLYDECIMPLHRDFELYLNKK